MVTISYDFSVSLTVFSSSANLLSLSLITDMRPSSSRVSCAIEVSTVWRSALSLESYCTTSSLSDLSRLISWYGTTLYYPSAFGRFGCPVSSPLIFLILYGSQTNQQSTMGRQCSPLVADKRLILVLCPLEILFDCQAILLPPNLVK